MPTYSYLSWPIGIFRSSNLPHIGVGYGTFLTMSIVPADIYLVSRRRESVSDGGAHGREPVLTPGPPASLSFASLVVDRHLTLVIADEHTTYAIVQAHSRYAYLVSIALSFVCISWYPMSHPLCHAISNNPAS